MTHDPRSPVDVQAEQQRATAAWCGYIGDDAVDRCNAEHDPLHRILAGFFDKQSPTLRWVASGYLDAAKAHPTKHEDAVGWEESLVLETQRWLNTGEWGPTIRVLWWLRIDPDKLRAALCRHLGREAVAG